MSKKERISVGAESPDSQRERVAITLNGESAEREATSEEFEQFSREMREILREADRTDAPIVAQAFQTWRVMEVEADLRAGTFFHGPNEESVN